MGTELLAVVCFKVTGRHYSLFVHARVRGAIPNSLKTRSMFAICCGAVTVCLGLYAIKPMLRSLCASAVFLP